MDSGSKAYPGPMDQEMGYASADVPITIIQLVLRKTSFRKSQGAAYRRRPELKNDTGKLNS